MAQASLTSAVGALIPDMTPIDGADPQEWYFSQGDTDGLPVAPPTPEKVGAMCESRFNLNAIQATTHGIAPPAIVNGPVRTRSSFPEESPMKAAASTVRLLVIASALCGAILSPTATAQYPDRPIRLVVPWPAGGGSDVVARMVAQPLGERLKQAIVVENRPGANGAIGTTVVAKSAKDGYTLIWVTADTHAIIPHVYPNLQYDARKDFASVGIAGYFPYALIVNPSFAAGSVSDFVAEAKARPGKVTFASWGVGGSAHVAMEMFRQQGGFEVLHVPFQGAAPAIQAVVGGQVDSMIVPISVADPHARGGRVKMLGLASPDRFVGTPDLRTFAEQGVPVNAGTWVGIMAPAGTSPEILQRLNSALNATIDTPAVRETLLKVNTEPSTMTVDQFKKFVDAEYDRWGKTIREAKIKLEQ